MRTTTFFAASAGVVFAFTYFIVRPAPQAPADPARPLSLAEIQQRRDAHQAAPKPAPPPALVKISTRDVSNGPTGRIADAKEQLNRSMVGMPFEMSASVLETCKRWNDCGRIGTFLERMAAEPRNPEWAPKMEQQLVTVIEIEERNEVRIRALECRRDSCAIEVASESQRGIQRAWRTGAPDLEWSGPSAYGTELDRATGILTYVSVTTLRRKGRPGRRRLTPLRA